MEVFTGIILNAYINALHDLKLKLPDLCMWAYNDLIVQGIRYFVHLGSSHLLAFQDGDMYVKVWLLHILYKKVTSDLYALDNKFMGDRFGFRFM